MVAWCDWKMVANGLWGCLALLSTPLCRYMHEWSSQLRVTQSRDCGGPSYIAHACTRMRESPMGSAPTTTASVCAATELQCQNYTNSVINVMAAKSNNKITAARYWLQPTGSCKQLTTHKWQCRQNGQHKWLMRVECTPYTGRGHVMDNVHIASYPHVHALTEWQHTQQFGQTTTNLIHVFCNRLRMDYIYTDVDKIQTSSMTN